jgi:hypothetical protein
MRGDKRRHRFLLSHPMKALALGIAWAAALGALFAVLVRSFSS